MKTTITGGKKGFTKAIDIAFATNAINPTIRYSNARGFHVESGIHPADSDVVWNCAANYCANDGSQSIRPKDYADVREQIISANA